MSDEWQETMRAVRMAKRLSPVQRDVVCIYAGKQGYLGPAMVSVRASTERAVGEDGLRAAATVGGLARATGAPLTPDEAKTIAASADGHTKGAECES